MLPVELNEWTKDNVCSKGRHRLVPKTNKEYGRQMASECIYQTNLMTHHQALMQALHECHAAKQTHMLKFACTEAE